MSAIWSEAVRFHREGNFAEAEQLYFQILQEAEENKDKTSYEVTWYHLARLAFDMGDLHNALRRYKRLLKIQEFQGDEKGCSRTSRHIAEIYHQKNASVDAIKWAEKALDIAEQKWLREQMAAAEHLLGFLYHEAAQPQKSASFFRRAQAIWEEVQKDTSLYRTTLVFAEVLEQQENYAAAIQELKRANKLLDPEKDMEESAELHFSMAKLYSHLSDNKQSLLHLLACLGRHREMNSPLMNRDAEAIQQIRISVGEDAFWTFVELRLKKEGALQLRALLNQFFPIEEVVEEAEEVPEMDTEQEIETEEDAVPAVQLSPEEVSNRLDTEEESSLGTELQSEEFSRTQELSKEKEEQQSPPVVVDWDKEDVDHTENSFFVQGTDAQILEKTRSKMKLTEYEIKNNFYRHFGASFFGVLLALVLVKLFLG